MTNNVHGTGARFAGVSPVLVGGVVVSIVVACFLLTYWNHFAGIRSGTIFNGIFFLNKGLIPYRDYFLWVPCLAMFKSSVILGLFGQDLIVPRIAGVLTRIVLSLCIYLWTCRFFSPSVAALGAIVCTIVGAGDVTDSMESINFDGILFAVAAGWCASYAIDTNRSNRGFTFAALFSGFLTAVSLLIKSNIGVGVSVAIPVVAAACIIHLQKSWRKGLIFCGMYFAGWFIPWAFYLLWLGAYGQITESLSQTWIKGPTSKASNPFGFIVKILTNLVRFWIMAFESLLLCFLTWRQIKQSALSDDCVSEPQIKLRTVLILGLVGVGLGATFALTLDVSVVASHLTAKLIQLLTIYFVEFSALLLSSVLAFRLLKGPLSERSVQLFFFVSISFTLAFMGSLSFPTYEPMVVPGLALLLALMLDNAGRIRTRIIAIVCAGLIAMATIGKLMVPFGFESMLEPPVREANFTSTVPKMKGFVLPKMTVDFIDKTVGAIEKYSTPEDTIFTYPEFGIFYYLTGRRLPTFCLNHNLDVTPEDLGKAEAQRILTKRPAVLIFAKQDFKELEALWRDGRVSGVRRVQEACEQLSREYQLVEQFDYDPFKIMVYVRPDRFAHPVRE